MKKERMTMLRPILSQRQVSDGVLPPHANSCPHPIPLSVSPQIPACPVTLCRHLIIRSLLRIEAWSAREEQVTHHRRTWNATGLPTTKIKDGLIHRLVFTVQTKADVASLLNRLTCPLVKLNLCTVVYFESIPHTQFGCQN